jgi:hypothetical protein
LFRNYQVGKEVCLEKLQKLPARLSGEILQLSLVKVAALVGTAENVCRTTKRKQEEATMQ